MKKENLSLSLSVFAVILGIASMCLCLLRVKPFTYNGITLAISVLVAAVTIYMFIHVINEFWLEKRIKNSISKDFGKKADDILYHNMYLVFFFQGVNEFRKTQCEAALYYFFKSMECLTKTSVNKDKMDEIILEIKAIDKDFPTIKILEKEAEEYIKIIASTGHKESGEIIKIITAMSSR